MPLFAYSAVLRNEKKELTHYLHHCTAASYQEAKGIAHEYFENNYPKTTIVNLLIQEVIETVKNEQSTYCYENTKVRSEFTLPDKLS